MLLVDEEMFSCRYDHTAVSGEMCEEVCIDEQSCLSLRGVENDYEDAKIIEVASLYIFNQSAIIVTILRNKLRTYRRVEVVPATRLPLST